MPRPPKNFEIAWVSVEPLGEGYQRTGPDTAVPGRFTASFSLVTPPAAVTIVVFMGADQRPYVHELTISSNVRTPVTTSVLRRVLVDQLLREALVKATVPAAEMDEWLASLPPQAQGRRDVDNEAVQAAQIYADAVEDGIRAPTMAVANGMNRSRAQAARYIRRARELGLLPAWEGT